MINVCKFDKGVFQRCFPQNELTQGPPLSYDSGMYCAPHIRL